jgi:3-dehydroquinate synthetase
VIAQTVEKQPLQRSTGRIHIGTQVSGLEKDAIVAASKNDKKMDSGIIKFILIHSIGDAYVDRTVTEDEMKQALDQVLV